MIELIYYSATWCGPCHMMQPIIDEIECETSGRVSVTRLDVDSNKERAIQAGIRSVPSIFIYKNGELFAKQIGAAPKSVIMSKLGL